MSNSFLPEEFLYYVLWFCVWWVGKLIQGLQLYIHAL